jgi:chromosome partitioning protein
MARVPHGVRKGSLMAQTIALLNSKGGVGKTTLAVNLAWHMHYNRRKNVLLVDLDPQFNATQYVMDFDAFEAHRKQSGTIADLLIDQPRLGLRRRNGKKDPRKALHRISTAENQHFDLLPAELGLAWVVKNPAQMEFRLEKLLSGIRDEYDYVFVDCAPTDSVLTTMALTASDFLLIPMRPDRFSILGLFNLRQTIETFRGNCPDPHTVKELGIVFTQVTDSSRVERESMETITASAASEGIYVFDSHLKYSNSFIRSVKDQTPIFHTAYAHKKSRAAASNIADEMEGLIAAFS